MLQNCVDLVKRLKHQNRIKIGLINPDGSTHIDKNKAIAKDWKKK